MKKLSRTKKIARKTIFAAFQILKEAGGEMRGKEVVDAIRQRVEFDDYEKHRYEKTGYIRWESILHFFTIDCMKAGYMRKQKGIWFLTVEGERARYATHEWWYSDDVTQERRDNILGGEGSFAKREAEIIKKWRER